MMHGQKNIKIQFGFMSISLLYIYQRHVPATHVAIYRDVSPLRKLHHRLTLWATIHHM